MSNNIFLSRYGDEHHIDHVLSKTERWDEEHDEILNNVASNSEVKPRHYGRLQKHRTASSTLAVNPAVPDSHVKKMDELGGQPRDGAIYSGRLSDDRLHELATKHFEEHHQAIMFSAKRKDTLDHIVDHVSKSGSVRMNSSLVGNPHLDKHHIKKILNNHHLDYTAASILNSAHGKDKEKAEVMYDHGNENLHSFMANSSPHKHILEKLANHPHGYISTRAKAHLSELS